MSELVDTTPHHEYEKALELMSFEDYRRICDKTNDFRKIGIQDAEAYADVARDTRTVLVNYAGKQVPLLAPIGFEKMYDGQRCRDMTAKPKVLLLGLPVDFVQERLPDTAVTLDTQMAIIIEQFVDVKSESPQHEFPIPAFITNATRSIDFPHPDLLGVPGHETAWMASYSFEFGPADEKPRPCQNVYLDQVITDTWHDYCFDNNQPLIPSENANETYLFSSKQLSSMPEVVEGLWTISEAGFGNVLGAHHPVAMEFNREFFDKQIVAENTVTAVHFVDGKPVCFGFIALDMNNNDWLNCESDVIQEDIKEAEEAERAHIHFHELISNGFEGMGYSTNILRTFLDIAARTGFDYTIFFESTNLSSTYIPDIIKKTVEANEKLTMKSEIEMLGRLTYHAVVKDA